MAIAVEENRKDASTAERCTTAMQNSLSFQTLTLDESETRDDARYLAREADQAVSMTSDTRSFRMMEMSFVHTSI